MPHAHHHAPPPADNWVWSPQGSIAMHLPEKWGFLQFASGPVNATPAVRNVEWPARSIAAAVYYAEHAFAAANNGTYTARVADLVPFLADAAIVNGACTRGEPVRIDLTPSGFLAHVAPVNLNARVYAHIDEQRLLTVDAQ